MRTYGVLGTGAVGGYYGALLRQAGFPVRFLARSGAEALRQNGLRVLSPRGDFHLPEVEVYDRAEAMPPCDVVLLSWKATSNSALPEVLPRVVKPDGMVVVLQNGLHPENEVMKALPGIRVVSGLCFLCCRMARPAVVEHQDYGAITLAACAPARSDAALPLWVQSIATDFEQAGIEIRLESDWKAARWKKLVWNIPFNGLTALLGVDTAEVLLRPAWVKLVRACMDEVVSGARLDGVDLNARFVEKMIDSTRAMKPYEPSMKLDRDAGRPMEVQAIYGDPIRRIESLGGQAPVSRVLYGLLAGIDGSNF